MLTISFLKFEQKVIKLIFDISVIGLKMRLINFHLNSLCLFATNI